MKSYCVIEFNDRDDKRQVLTLLSDTEVEFKVTADLKKFVAEKFSVTILENVFVSPNDTDTVAINKEIVENIVDVAPTTVDTFQAGISQNSIETKVKTGDRFAVVPPTINTIQEGQDSTQPFSVPGPIVADQPILDIDNTQNLMNMDDYGTFVPYLKKPVEPKKENIDNTAAVVDNTSVDDVLKANQVGIPSPTMKRRLCRSAKKPRYLIAEDSDEEYSPVTKQSRKTDQTLETVAAAKKKRATCNKCGKEVNGWYSAKMDHVTMHTGIMKFECLVDGCGLECKLRGNIVKHMKTRHSNQLNAFTNIELTIEQNAEIDTMMYDCFGEPDCNIDDNCQICNQKIGGNSSNSSSLKKEHALHHVDFMLYKCVEDDCSFESKTMRRIMLHTHQVHSKKATPQDSKIQLSKEQELKVEDIVIKCFPNLDKDRSAT